MRAGVIALAMLAVVPRLAAGDARLEDATGIATEADGRIEASAFVGMEWYADDSGLGNSWAAEQVPHNAPVFGIRGGVLALPAIVERGGKRLQLAIEGELALATSSTGSTFPSDGGRMSYFVPVFAWRGQLALRLAGFESIRPHLIVGAGAETVASSSPFMAKETDGIFYWGPGATVPAAGRWLVRFDVRQGVVPSRDGGMTSSLEAQLGVVAVFGGAPRTRPRPAEPEPRPPDPVADTTDSDGDGLADRTDRCPNQKAQTPDGCPLPDPDGDRLVGAADKCPDQAEDFDRFTDEDGCLDRDNDGDGIEDTRDACAMQPETPNGLDDQDGCPDTIPDDVTKALAAAGAIKFEPRRARLTTRAKDALLPVQNMLSARGTIRIVVVGRADKAGSEDLARRRAEAVKWHLVDEGVLPSRIDVQVGAPGKPAIELTVAAPAPSK